MRVKPLAFKPADCAIDRRRPLVWAGLALGAVLLGTFCFLTKNAAPEAVFQPASRVVEPGPLCPWREPESDLRRFFPGATGWRAETLILSGQRLELQRVLGRAPDAEENALKVYRVEQANSRLGVVLTRRLKGEHGAIELVLALDNNDRAIGLRLQRLREPGPIAEALESPDWLAAFAGKDAHTLWRTGELVSSLPPDAQISGHAIEEGVRSLLLVHALAERTALSHHHS